MAPGHAVSGIALWLGGWATAQSLGWADPAPAALVVGGAITAGAAVLPDLDHPQSRISNCAGPISRVAGSVLARTGSLAHRWIRTRWDGPVDQDGHRTVSHTLVFAGLAGWAAGAAGETWGGWAVAALVFVLGGVGLDAALDATPFRNAWSLPMSVVLAAGAGLLVPGTAWWIGPAVTVGCVAHCLGDSITASACPYAWPFPLPERRVTRRGTVQWRWRMWKALGPPRWLRFRVNGKVENLLVVPALLAAGAWAGYLLATN